MKKVMSLFWVSCICVAMIGCGGDSDSAPATGGGDAAPAADAPADDAAPAADAPAADAAPAE